MRSSPSRGVLVCRYHVLAHAATHSGGTVDRCFPSIALASAATVVRLTAVDMAQQRTASRLGPETVAAYDEFLNFIAPGYAALAAAVERSPDAGLRDLVSQRIDPASEEQTLAFAPEFWSEGAMERVATLAMVTMQSAWRREQSRQEKVGNWLGIPVSRALTLMLNGVLNTDRVEALIQAVAPGIDMPKSLVRALTYSQPPGSADVIASWMVSEFVEVAG